VISSEDTENDSRPAEANLVGIEEVL